MYKNAKDIVSRIKDVGRYLRQALAIKFDGIVTQFKLMRPSDLDSILEVNKYLCIGESKHTLKSGPAALMTHITEGQRIMFKNMIEGHDAFCWYQFGDDKVVRAIRLENKFFTYERHDQSYPKTDCPTTNAYILVSLYHQLTVAFATRYKFGSWRIARGDSLLTEGCFNHIVECAIHSHYVDGKSLVIPVSVRENEKMIQKYANSDENDYGFHIAVRDLFDSIEERIQYVRVISLTKAA